MPKILARSAQLSCEMWAKSSQAEEEEAKEEEEAEAKENQRSLSVCQAWLRLPE